MGVFMKTPFIYMMFSVLSWSLFPLMSVWGIQQLSVFDYILWTYAVGFVTSGLFFCMLPKQQKDHLPKLAKVDRKIFAEVFVACLCAILSFGCLLKSFSYLPRASATIAFEIWLIMAIFAAPLLAKKGWEKISHRDFLFSLLAVAGAGFLLIPEAQSVPLHRLLLPLAGGVFMTIASAIKPRVAHKLENKSYPIASLFKIQVLFSGVTVLLSIPIALLWPDKHSVYTAENLMIILFTGVVIHTLGNILYTLGMLRSEKGNILVLWCLKPIFAVLWLWLAGQTEITEHILLGAIFIVTASMMITVRPEKSYAYTAAIVSLLLCGTYTFFVDGKNMTDYYQSLSAPIVFYAIRVAFMMDRFIKRGKKEEDTAVEMLNYIDEHASKMGAAAEGYRKHIIGMITAREAAQINTHYQAVRNEEHGHLKTLYNQLDKLALSKVHGNSFSEMFILFIVGTLTIATATIYRPNNLIADGFAVIVSLSIIFIFFSVLDLSHDRCQFYLERDAKGSKSLSRDLTKNLFSERVISTVLIVMILAALTGLLLMKHSFGVY